MPRYLYILLALWPLGGCSQKSGEPVSQLEVAAAGAYTGAISNDGQFAVVGSIHHGVSLWRLADGERLFDWQHQPPLDTTLIAADFSPDGRYAVTADVHTLALWELATGKATRYWSVPAEILDVALAADASTALLGLADHTAVLFDVRRGGVLRTLAHDNRVRSVSISDDRNTAVTGSEDYSAVAWNLRTGEVIARMQHNDDVQLVRISGDGELILSVSKYDKAVVWQTATGKALGEVPLAAEHLKRGLRFTSARFSSDNRWLVTGRPDQLVSLWRLPDLTPVGQWKIPRRDSWKPTGAAVLDLAFSADQQLKALASNGFVATLSFADLVAAREGGEVRPSGP